MLTIRFTTLASIMGLLLSLGGFLGNLLYAYLTDRHYGRAYENSYWQVIMLALLFFCLWLLPR
jgi:hypothetical protein